MATGTGRKYKNTTHRLLRSSNLDDYLRKQWEDSAPFEKMRINQAVGGLKTFNTFLEMANLDKKLLMLTYLNKGFCLQIFDTDKNATHDDMKSVLNYYKSTKGNYESDEARRKLNVFIIDSRAVAKYYYAGQFRFSERTYRISEKGKLATYVSEIRTPNVSISNAERSERNYNVYQMICKVLAKGFFLDAYLNGHNLDYGMFKILLNLFIAERPLTRDETLDKDEIINYVSRHCPSGKRLNHLVRLQMVDEHKFGDTLDDGTIKKMQVFTISAKGIDTYLQVMKQIMSDV